MTYYTYYPSDLYLAHHGIKGQKWGIRRFQNPDGTLTEEGLRRYGKSVERGRQLRALGRTKGGTIARGIGKQAGITLATLGGATGIGVGTAVGISALTNKYVDRLASEGTLTTSRAMKALYEENYSDLKRDAERLGYASAGASFIGSVGAISATVLNVVNTARDFRDIRRAEIVDGKKK